MGMVGAAPEISACEVSGLGLSRAVAGKPSIVRVRLRDKYHNAALPMREMRFGLAMLPTESSKEAAPKPKRQHRIW